MTFPEPLLSLFAVPAAAVLSALMTWAIRPMLLRHALATPNARSSHRLPTPQGAGIAVIGATLVVAGAAMTCAGIVALNIPVAVFVSSLFIAVVGFADDLKSMPVLTRLLLQAVAVGAIIFTAPGEIRIVPPCPIWIERGLLLLAGLWFVNLVNFMDGLDWMTVAEIVPITGAMVVLGTLGEFPLPATLVAAALCGGMLGFAPFNRPVATIFLGDVGSLPIGLLLGWCLLQLAYHQAIRRSIAAADVLSPGRDRDLVAPPRQARAVLGGASLAFLSARDRQRFYRVAGGRRSVRAQHRAGGTGGRIDHGTLGHDQARVPRRRRHRRSLAAAPVRATAHLIY